MRPLYKVILEEIWKFISDRVFLLAIIFAGMFYLLVAELFDLQVVNSDAYEKQSKPTTQKTIVLDAPRGQIYDRMGRPLATNETAFGIKIDPAIRGDNTYDMYKKMIEVFDEAGEKVLPDFPFTYDPIAFNFDGNQSKEDHFKKDMGIPADEVDDYDAAATYAFIFKLFKVPPEASREETHKTLGVAAAVYTERFRLSHITVALNVSDRTVAAIEERKNEFPGAYADVIYLRNYEGGETMSHMLGYIRKISQEELEANKDLGYTSEDMYGKVGLEKSFEENLRGVKGEKIVEVDAAGRQLGIVSVTDPIPGDKIFLTIDSEFQKKVVRIIEDTLQEILLGHLQTGELTMEMMFSAMIEGYTIDADIIVEKETFLPSMREKILAHGSTPREAWKKDTAKDLLLDLFETNEISQGELLLFLYRDEQITLEDEELVALRNNSINIKNLVISKIKAGEITPQMTKCEPYTGSAVVVDVRDGSMLASASYPNYDNNQFVNQFNNEYYKRILKDPSAPLLNRPFSEGRAPGSTLKMVTAYAALDAGTVGLKEQVRDLGVFTKAGTPHANCNTRRAGYHGLVDVRMALEVSCNYFFYENSYRMSQMKNEEKNGGINLLNQYMESVGIGLPTGIEISELTPVLPSPAYKEEVTLNNNPQATSMDAAWNDGDTIRAAIGQSVARITPATMGKYIATIANGGKRYSLHFLDSIEKANDGGREAYIKNLELDLLIENAHVEAIHDGMNRVITGTQGTGRNVFKNFPMNIGGKTGTAQEQGKNHATFAAFAPFEEPEIAIFVLLPFSENRIISSPAAHVTKEILNIYFDLDLHGEKEAIANYQKEFILP